VNWPCAGAAVGFSAALLMALVTMDVVTVPFAKRDPTVVRLIEIPLDPPQVALPPPDTKIEPVEVVEQAIVAPKPIVAPPPVPAPALATVSEPPPVRATIVAPAPSAPAMAGPVSVGDLSAKLLSGKPPKYPIESRRKREQGTVLLSVLLSTAGTVADISVSRSSGFPRLDKAALDAVRRWKWSPTVQSGQAVMVKGIVEIPFLLTA
jgi:protein TonB